MKPKGWFSRRHQTSEAHSAAARDSKGDRKSRADERANTVSGTPMIMAMKFCVKQGQLMPQEALKQLVASADNVDAALESHTARWLGSPNAMRRYKQALKTKKKVKS